MRESEPQAEGRTYNDQELAHIQSQRARLVFGSPGTCKARLLELAEQYAADELMILTITGDYESRKKSYELLAEAFTLRA